MDNKASFIWLDKDGQGRNLYGMFRKTFELKSGVKKAVLHLFADSSYQLFVNGKFVEFGPVRFDPRFPKYDTHDITPYLRSGRNVIALLVNYYGCRTFVAIPAAAGLIAWGQAETENGEITDFSTGSTRWKCKKALAYHSGSHKISFALNPVDIFFQEKEESGWILPEFHDEDWPDAVELEKQDTWGPLSPRTIPYMSGKPVQVAGVLKTLPLEKREEIYSFEMPLPYIPVNYLALERITDYCGFMAYSTWIYSPCRQTVRVGVYLGDSWINGEKLEAGILAEGKSLRMNQVWTLQEGWNYYFGSVGVYQDVFQFYLALPAGKGLRISADRDLSSSRTFRYTPMLTKAAYQEHLEGKALPYGPEESLEEVGGWLYATDRDTAHNACRETGWDDYGGAVEVLTPGTLQGHVFPADRYPDGFCVLLDLGHMHLVLPRFKLRGTGGATVDMVFSEHFTADGIHFNHRTNFMLGDRVYCSRDELDWMPSHPRGGRYVGITVRNITGDITLEEITFRSANYPAEEKGSFRCSDPCLEAVWEIGKRTQAANMEDAYVDCSGRERGLYARDSIIQYHVNLAVFGDQALMEHCLDLFGQSPDTTGKFRATYPNIGSYTISDFALDMSENYLSYYRFSGNTELIRKYWKEILVNLAWFSELADEREDLLLDAEWDVKRGVAADYGGFHGDLGAPHSYLSRKGIHCIFSIEYLIALQSTVELAALIGRQEDVKDLERRIAILTRTIPDSFWDEEKGCFADNLEFETHSAHASLYAVRAGIVAGERLERVRRYVAGQMENLFFNGYDPSEGALTSPNYAFYILDGLYKAGLAGTAENLMRQGWGWILSQGFKTCPEYFTAEASHCHAWSAGPTYYLSRYALGISFPEAPNMDRVALDIQTGGLRWAEGTLPHPKGVIGIKWHAEGERKVIDSLHLPKGVEFIGSV